MTVLEMQPLRPAREKKLSELLPTEKDSQRMYAIAFDLDTNALQTYYDPDRWRNAYGDISREFALHGFQGQQGSLYFGRQGTTPVTCVLAVQAVGKKYAWFSKVVRDIRMLRIEENNDLLPAIGQLDLPLAPRAANG
jgi:virulence-associated protein VapD